MLLAGLVPEEDGEEDVYTEMEEDKLPVVLCDGCEEVGEVITNMHAAVCFSAFQSSHHCINTLSRTE